MKLEHCFQGYIRDPYEVVGEGFLRPARLAFGYTIRQKEASSINYTERKVQYSVAKIFLFLLLLPLTVPISLMGIGLLYLSSTYQRHHLAKEKGYFELNYSWEVAREHSLLLQYDRAKILQYQDKTCLHPDNSLTVFDVSLPLRRFEKEYCPQISIQSDITSFSDTQLQGICEVRKECFNTIEDIPTVPMLKKQLDCGTKVMIAVDENQTVVGVLQYREERYATYISCIARKAAYAKLGIGKMLIDELKEKTKEPYTLHVRTHNTPAFNLYRKCGFSHQSIVGNYYRGPIEDAYYMTTV